MLTYGANLVHFYDSGSIKGLLLPAFEGVARRLGDKVRKEQPLLHLDGLVAQDLSAHVGVVLEQLPAPNLGQAVPNVARGEVLLVIMHIALGSPVVLDHLEGRLQVSVIEATGHVGKFQNQCLVTMVLAHQLAEA